MADKWPLATGVWSNAANWNSGTLPTASDDVYADGKTVTIDQDVTVITIRTTTRSGGVAGGGFIVSSSRTITMTGTGYIPGTGGGFTLSQAAGNTVNIVGAITGGATTGLSINGGGATNITGSVTGGTAANCYGISINAGANGHSLSITGNLTGGTSGSSTGTPGLSTSVGATITIVGNVTANVSAGMNITGAASTVNVTGNLTANGVLAAFTSSQGGTYTLIGTLTPSANISAVNFTGSPTVTITGPFISNASGCIPFSGPFASWKLSPTVNNEFRFKTASGTSSLYSTDVTSGSPAASNVRSGVTYGIGGVLTGTCAVPAPASVAYGVPVDNTFGTDAISATEIARLVGLQIAASVST
jgi:hypothetical protein